MRRFFPKLLQRKLDQEDDLNAALAAKIHADILKSAAKEAVKEARLQNEVAEAVNYRNGFSKSLRDAFRSEGEEERPS